MLLHSSCSTMLSLTDVERVKPVNINAFHSNGKTYFQKALH